MLRVLSIRDYLAPNPPIMPIILLEESETAFSSGILDRQVTDHGETAADPSWEKIVIGRRKPMIGYWPITREAYLSLILPLQR